MITSKYKYKLIIWNKFQIFSNIFIKIINLHSSTFLYNFPFILYPIQYEFNEAKKKFQDIDY